MFYDDSECPVEPLPLPARSEILSWLVDDTGKALSGVTVEPRHRMIDQVSDAFGRIFVRAPPGFHWSGKLTKVGYAELEIEFVCPSADSREENTRRLGRLK